MAFILIHYRRLFYCALYLATRAAAARHFTKALYAFNTIISNENYLTAWAFVEAAHFAIQFNSKIKSFYQRKKAKTKVGVAIKAVAHKLCRACYYIMRGSSRL
jgi:transposase